MPIHYTIDGGLYAVYLDEPKMKYRPLISKALVNKFGKGSYTAEKITKALFFSFDWYADKLMDILKNENEVSFFQWLFILHEFAAKSHQNKPNKSPLPQMDDQDFALYRRVLKLCLEQACDIPLNRNVPFPTLEFLKKKESVIDEILYLGDFLYEFANLLASQHMIEDCVDLKFTADNLFYFTHKHHYGFVIERIMGETNDHLADAVTGATDLEDLSGALKNAYGVGYPELYTLIEQIQRRNDRKGGKIAMEEWYAYAKNLELVFEIPYETAETIFAGLTLSRHNKMSLKDAVLKPYHINKYLYRPILLWNVKGIDRALIGLTHFIEAFVSLATNAVGWGKYPPEWDKEEFKEFIKRKVKLNDKILEDAGEAVLKENNILYDRNVINLKSWNNRNLNIENEECGEIDYLFILGKKLIICDSKHLISRYDMSNFRNDHAAFETHKKAYNKTMSKKIRFIERHLPKIEEHFQVVTNNRLLRLNITRVDGIFLVNTPTFIMYNNSYRIFTIKDLKSFVTDSYKDMKYQLLIDHGNEQSLLFIKYPYFQKPKYFVFDPHDDEL